MRTANISIAFAVLAFMTLLNFETLSHLSTQETYFQRYEGVWDVRVMFEDAARYGVDEGVVSELRALDGVTGVTFGDVYKEDSDDAFYNVLTDSARSARQVTSMLEDRYSGEQGVEVLNLDEEAVRDERSSRVSDFSSTCLPPCLLQLELRMCLQACWAGSRLVAMSSPNWWLPAFPHAKYTACLPWSHCLSLRSRLRSRLFSTVRLLYLP